MLRPLKNKSHRRTSHSVGYLRLLSPPDVLAAKAKLDGHAFVGSRGTTFRCAVEYAPFQRVPPPPPAKRSKLEGTIEQGACLFFGVRVCVVWFFVWFSPRAVVARPPVGCRVVGCATRR